MSKKKDNNLNIDQVEDIVVNETDEIVEETLNVVEPEPVIEEVKDIIGVVTECTKLNVRKKPNAKADVVAVINLATEVTVDEKASTKEFYKVKLANGVVGFCMKKFINIGK